ncbi:MAG: VWA domain-containing protein, partial [Actinomycetia bacterium]|nr:VWA domain-containing protein [Actinomycetes bacterium]
MMFRIGAARVARTLSISAMAVAMLAGIGLPYAAAGPGDPVTTVDRLSVDKPTQATTVDGSGGSASLTTVMQGSTVNPVIDVAFVLDTTGSMSSKIATMSQGLSQFAQNIASAGGKDLAFGIYVFGDLNVSECTATPDVQRWELPLTPLGGTTTINTVVNRLNNLPRNNGCDSPEDSIWAGFTVSATAPWRAGAQREVIVVTDSPGKENSGNVNGQAATLANWKAYATANNIHVTIVPAPAATTSGGAGTKSQIEMANTFGSDASAVLDSASAYVSYLTNQIVFQNGAAISFTIVPKLTVTYADGTTSTDAIVTSTPSVATTVGASAPVAFTLEASLVPVADIARPGATTTVYQEFVDQRSGSIVARQTITLTAPAAQTANVVFVDDDNG